MYSSNTPEGSIPLGVLKKLEGEFPEVVVTPGMDPDRIMYRAGQRSVVLKLLETYDPRGFRNDL